MTSYAKVGDSWVETSPFQRTATGWTATSEMYVKSGGEWEEIYNIVPVKPTGKLASEIIPSGGVQVTISNLNVPVEKVVVHTGTTQYQSVPVSVTDRYTVRDDYFRVFDDLHGDPPMTFMYPPAGDIKASTWYYSTAWAQDSTGAWHVLSRIRVNSGTPKEIPGVSSMYTEVFRPVEIWRYRNSTKAWTQLKDSKILHHTASAVTSDYRLVFMYKDTISNFFKNRVVAGGWFQFQRFNDAKADGIYQLGFHTTNSNVAAGIDSYSMFSTLVDVPKTYSGTGLRQWTGPFGSDYYRNLLAAGTVRSVSINLHPSSQGYAGLSNSFYLAPTGTMAFNYRNRTMSYQWTRRTHEVI